MKTFFRTLAGSVVLVLASCASTPSVGPFTDLEQQALDLGGKGFVAALGTGVDETGRYDFALEKAKLNARAQIAQQYGSQISGMLQQFADEYSGTTSVGTEVNEAFKTATENVFKKTLTGVRAMSVAKQFKEKNRISVGIVMGVDAKALNASLLDEVKVADPKLYERFRASQAFEELKKETEGM